MSDSGSDDENVEITLNYQGKREKVKFDQDYNYLYTEALNAFSFDKNKYFLSEDINMLI